MAWGESKAWLKGTAKQKLYQGLLEDAPEYRPDVVLTGELVQRILAQKIKAPA